MRFSLALFVLALFVLGAALDAHAQQRRFFETFDESRQRHSAERWRQYEQNRRQAPLGGYRDTLGDPAPYGTERPGYRSPQPYGSRPPTYSGPGQRGYPRY